MPKISVIVPVYKVESYLNECIDSILNQTYTNFELILVDDGSPDNCPQICDEYRKKDKRVITIHKPNGGLSSARNAGIDYSFKYSNTEYITFVDSDDYLDKDYLKCLLNSIGNADLSLCYFFKFADFVPNKSFKKSILEFNNIDYWNIPEAHGIREIAPCKLYKKSLFSDLRFTEGALYEDGLIMYKLVDKCSRIILCPRALYFYRVRSDSIMGTSIFNDFFNELEGLERQIDRTNYYLSKHIFELFPKNYNLCLKICMRLYFHHPLKTKKTYIKLRNVYFKKKKEKKIKTSRGEKLFFTFPYLYCFFYRFKQFFIN